MDESGDRGKPFRRDPPKPSPETDPRFPSGEWKGFWLQRGWPGRQWMRLVLQFAEGQVRGEGQDIVGAFVMSGRYSLSDGLCTIVKHYVRRHQVLYNGYNDGDGLWLWGTWRVCFETGGFHLWPKGEADPTGSTLAEEKELPAAEDRVLVGIGLGEDLDLPS